MEQEKRENIFTLRIPEIGYEGSVSVKVIKKCRCKISFPAKNFNQLVELVKQAEEMLTTNNYTHVEDRISIIRGIYYGTIWSLDYTNEKSAARNWAFDNYTGSKVVADARKVLKCSEDCKANLFNSLYNSFEIFDSKYKAVDFGHLIIGLDSRRSWISENWSVPIQGATGLEANTWVGDLGGGVGFLSMKRITQPNRRAKTLFPIGGSSYGAMVNLEGDVAAYVVGMDTEEQDEIVDMTDNFDTIHEALSDYFGVKWNNRAFYFLKMLGGEFSNCTLTNRDEIIEDCAEVLASFAQVYIAIRIKEKGWGGGELLANASQYFNGAAKEVASIFIDGLIHTVDNPNDMITARTDPEPTKKGNSTIKQLENLGDKLYKQYKKYD